MSMNQLEEFKEGLQYSDEVRNAVRYGYQYRIEAEKPESSFIHHCLPEAPQILFWLAQCIIGGIVWDVIKLIAKNAYTASINSKKPLSAALNNILTDEHELQKFFEYVKDFNEHSMALTEKQFKRIREEILADHHAKEVTRIIEQEKRMPTHEDYLRIFHEGQAHADRLMKPKDIPFNAISQRGLQPHNDSE